MARLGPKGHFVPGDVDDRVHPLVAAVEGAGHAENFVEHPDPVPGRGNGSVIRRSFQPVPGGSDLFRGQAEYILGFADPSVFILQFKNEGEPGEIFSLWRCIRKTDPAPCCHASVPSGCTGRR